MTATTAFAPFTSTPIPLSRLIDVESRKLVDTRAGFWLLAAIAALMVGVGGLIALVWRGGPAAWAGATEMTLAPVALLLPVLAVLTMTSEWTTRSGLVTFALEPRRWRTLLAKGVVLLGAMLAGLVLALAAGAGSVLLQQALHGATVSWAMPGYTLAGFVALLACSTFFGAALGLLTQNSAAAIVTVLVMPTVLGILSALSGSAAAVLNWVDFNAVLPFLDTGWGTGTDWARLATSAAVMVVLPAALGVWRAVRQEVA